MNGQELIKLKLPALFISRPFQVGNLAPILSISGCMSAPLDAVGEAFRILSSKKKLQNIVPAITRRTFKRKK